MTATATVMVRGESRQAAEFEAKPSLEARIRAKLSQALEEFFAELKAEGFVPKAMCQSEEHVPFDVEGHPV